jgi:hypothetical protein
VVERLSVQAARDVRFNAFRSDRQLAHDEVCGLPGGLKLVLDDDG